MAYNGDNVDEEAQTRFDSLFNAPKSQAAPKPKLQRPTTPNPHIDTVRKAYEAEGLDPDWGEAIMGQESGGNPNAVSPKGATGLMQIMPGTFKQFGGDINRYKDPEENARVSAKIVKHLSTKYGGDFNSVLMGYNAGEGARDKYGADVTKWPGYQETKNYVPSINNRYQKIKERRGIQPATSQVSTQNVVSKQPTTQPANNADNEAQALFDKLYNKPTARPQTQARPNNAQLDNIAFQLRDKDGQPLAFSKPEIEAYKETYGVHPAQDKAVEFRGRNFLSTRRTNDVIPGQRTNLFETSFTPNTLAGQERVASYGQGATTGFTGNNLNLSDLANALPNQTGNEATDAAIYARNPGALMAGNVTGNVAQLAALANVLKGAGTLAPVGSTVSKVLGATEATSIPQAAAKTGLLFGAQSALSNPDPEGKMSLAQNIGARIKAGIEGGTMGAVSGYLAGINPSLLREIYSFTGPGAVKTYLKGYLEGKPDDQISQELIEEGISNAAFPVAMKGLGLAAGIVGGGKGEGPIDIQPDPKAALDPTALPPTRPIKTVNTRLSDPSVADVQPTVNGERVPRTPVDNSPTNDINLLQQRLKNARKQGLSYLARQIQDQINRINRPVEPASPTEPPTVEPISKPDIPINKSPYELRDSQVIANSPTGDRPPIVRNFDSPEQAKAYYDKQVAGPSKPIRSQESNGQYELAGDKVYIKGNNPERPPIVKSFDNPEQARAFYEEKIGKQENLDIEPATAVKPVAQQAVDPAELEQLKSVVYGEPTPTSNVKAEPFDLESDLAPNRPAAPPIENISEGKRPIKAQLDKGTVESLPNIEKIVPLVATAKNLKPVQEAKPIEPVKPQAPIQRPVRPPIQPPIVKPEPLQVRSLRKVAANNPEALSPADKALLDRYDQKTKPKQYLSEGKKTSAVTARGSEVKARYALVEADNIRTSNQEGYPQALQPRDRDTRVANQDQMARMGSKFDPQQLGEARLASTGAPIIGEDGNVESGNGRVNLLRRIYANDSSNAKAYRQFLLENAEKFGLDPEAIKKAKTPVLVRVRETDITRERFAVEANENPLARMSPVEQAKVDGRRLDDKLISKFAPTEDGNVLTAANKQGFIPEFLNKVIGPEKAAYLDADGNLNIDGVKRIKDAIFAAAYGDTPQGIRLLQKIAESPDNNIKIISNALLNAANKFAKLKLSNSSQAKAVTGDLMAAVDKLVYLKENGIPVNEYLNQKSLFEEELSPRQKQILQVIADSKRSGKAIAQVLNKYVDIAKQPDASFASALQKAVKGSDDQMSLFQKGKTPKTEPSPIGPNRERVAREVKKAFSNVPPEQIDQWMLANDAIAMTEAKRNGTNPDDYYKQIEARKATYHDKDRKDESIKGKTQFFADGRRVIVALEKHDFSTVVHEFGHIAREHVEPNDQKLLDKWVSTIHGEKAFQKDGKWSRESEETFTDGLERYLHDGIAPTKELGGVFAKIKSWMTDVYGNIRKILGQPDNRLNINIPPEIRGVLDRLFGGDGKPPFKDGTPQPKTTMISSSPLRRPSPGPSAMLQRGSNVISAVPELANTSKAAKPASKLVKVEAVDYNKPFKPRKIYSSVKDNISQSLADILQPQDYNDLTNRDAFAEANDLIKRSPGAAQRASLSTSLGGNVKPAVQNALSMELIRKAQARGDHEEAAMHIHALAERSTQAGQAIQVLRNIGRISPEGVGVYAERQLRRDAEKSKDGKFAIANEEEIINRLKRGDNPNKVIDELFQKDTPLADQFKAALMKVARKQIKQERVEARTPQEQAKIDKQQAGAKTAREKFNQEAEDLIDKDTFARDQVVREFIAKKYKLPTVTEKLSKELYEMAKEAQNLKDYEYEFAMAKIRTRIAEEAHYGLADQVKFWNYSLALFNPPGWITNTIADAVYGSPIGVEHWVNNFAAGLDYLALKTGVVSNRSVAIEKARALFPEYKKNLGRAAREIWGDVSTNDAADSRNIRPIVPFKEGGIIKPVAKIFNRATRFGYGWGQEANYKTTYNATLDNLQRVAEMNGRAVTEPTTLMREAAKSASEYRTGVDNNGISRALQKLQDALNVIGFGKDAKGNNKFGLGNLVVKFAKIPGSYLRKGVAFSPIGLFTDIAPAYIEYKKAIATGSYDTTVSAQRTLMQYISRATLGTALGGLGLGVLGGVGGFLLKQSEEKGEGKLAQLQSDQGIRGQKLNLDGMYRFALGLMTSRSYEQAKQDAQFKNGDLLLDYDFIQPAGFVTNLGLNAWDSVERYRKGEGGVELAGQAITNTIGNTLNDVQVIQSLRDAQENGDDSNYWVKVLENLGMSTLLPPVVRQIKNYQDNIIRSSDSLKERAMANTPGLSKQVAPTRQAFGEERERITGGNSGVTGLLNTFATGGKFSRITTDPEKEQAIDIYKNRTDKDKRGSHIPSAPEKYIDKEGVEKTLSKREKSEAMRVIGPQARELYREAGKSSEFNNAPANVKGSILGEGLGPIRQRAKVDVLGEQETKDTPKKDRIIGRDTSVYGHNAKLETSRSTAMDNVKNSSDYKGLTRDQQKFANDKIEALFSKAKIDELKLPNGVDAGKVVTGQSWIHRPGFTNKAIEQILDAAKRYQPPRRP